jgi:DNA gyrase subunit A
MENDKKELMMVTQNGIMIRTPVAGINCIGRNTQGVRLINVDTGDRVIDMTRVVKEEEAVEGVEDGTAADGVTTDGADNGQMPAQALEAAAEEEVAEEEAESEQESDDPLQDEDLDN